MKDLQILKLTSIFINPRNQILILLVSWSIINYLIYFHTGIQPVLESLKYINAAETLLSNGELPSIRFLFYLTTTLVIAFSFKIGLGVNGVIIIQLLTSLFATLYFYKSLQIQQKNYFSSFITSMILIFCYPFYSWNFYLYTESLFYSLALIFFSNCIRQKNLTLHKLLVQVLLIILVIISRPLGILFLLSWIVYLVLSTDKKYKRLLVGTLIIGLGIVLFVVNTILSNIKGWEPLLSAEYKYIICDIPTGSHITLEKLKNKSSIAQIFHYITQYPSEFISLGVERLKAFYLLIRPYYSSIHNLMLLVMILVLYFPIVLNIIFNTKKLYSNKHIFSLLIVLSFTFAIILQCDDYHNRFYNTIIPIFLYLGVFTLINNIKRFDLNKHP